jgi:hypothetical protein
MKDLYQVLTDKLTNQAAKDLFASKQLPAVKFIDIYKGQYLNFEAFELIPLPAVFVELAVDKKNGLAAISLHVVYEVVRDTSSLGQNQDKALGYLEFIKTIDELVVDVESENTGKLEDENTDPVQMDAIGTAHILTYSCSYSNKIDVADKFQWTDEEETSFNLTGTLVDQTI